MTLPAISEQTKALSDISKNVSPILRPIFILMHRFLPKKMVNEYTSKYLDWTFLNKNRQMFDSMLDDLQKQVQVEINKINDGTDILNDITVQKNIELISSYTNYVKVLKQAVITAESEFLNNGETNGRLEHDDDSVQDEETSYVWFDLFQETAMRRNEAWRTDLLARCVVLENREPNSISIKTLWDIGMLDTLTFHAFAMFLDSCMFVDGFPVMLLDEDQLHVKVSDESKSFQGVLGEFMSLLIDEGLIQRKSELFRYAHPLDVESKLDKKLLIHKLHKDDNEIYMVGLDGYFCTRFGQDINRLYDAQFNNLSAENVNELAGMLNDSDGDIILVEP